MLIKDHQNPVFLEESNNLQILENVIQACSKKIRSEIEVNLQKMKTEKEPAVLKQLDQEIIQHKNDEDLYESCKQNPYYARITFQTNGKTETYVIGKKGLNDYDHKSDILVVDWRTDIGQAYNLKSKKQFNFDGELYNVILRRSVKIQNAKLVSCNNEYSAGTARIPQSGLIPEKEYQTFDKDRIINKQSDDIVDPFLLELLEDHRRQNAVTDIIATIQEKQNEIISQPYDKNFIVQGCSGSGKTMILLHRLSYLIYNKLQEKIPLNNIRIITPNKEFSYFIDNLMHQLDLDNIPVMTVENLYADLIKRVTTGLEADFTSLSDTNLPPEMISKYYSMDFLNEIVEKYNEYWQHIVEDIRENALDERYNELCNGPEQYNFKGYQELFSAHSRDSHIIELLTRDVEEAKTRLENSMSVIYVDLQNKLEHIPEEAQIIFNEQEKCRQEKKITEEKIQNNLPARNRMDSFLNYEKFKSEPGNPIAKAVYTRISVIIDKIQKKEKELAAIPDYAFLQKYEINEELQKLKAEYTKGAREALDEHYHKFDIWKETIINCDKKIQNFDEQLNRLQEQESILKSLQSNLKFQKKPEDLIEKPDFEKWKGFLAPYFESKESLRQAEIRRETSEKYQQYKKTSQLLDQLRLNAVYKNVYKAVYQSDIEGKCGHNEQFHFELFLKLHFCQRYFGPLSTRMMINIDEGQILNLSEYMVLRNFLGWNTVLNIYGDINQKIDFNTGISNWNDISDIRDIFVLNENYRNTKQVTEFCNKQFYSKLIPIGIEGPDVQQSDAVNAVRWIIKQHTEKPNERCAIIWNGSTNNKTVIENLVKGRLDVCWKFNSNNEIYILTAEQSRGLEFENVVVFAKNMSLGGKYISYTRSLNHLVVVDEIEPEDQENISVSETREVINDIPKDESENISKNMISQTEFVRRVNVQPETIAGYIREGKLIPDRVVQLNANKKGYYFAENTLLGAVEQFGWKLIDDDNRKEQFIQMVQNMDMSASYKPVFLKGFFAYADRHGRAKLNSIIRFFRGYYEDRRARGMVVERRNSLLMEKKYSYKAIEKLILQNPYKRFESMGMMHYDKNLGIVEMDQSVWKNLTEEEKKNINRECNLALDRYYLRFVK